MADSQGFFDELFRDQIYSLRGDFTPRQWHQEATNVYAMSVMQWQRLDVAPADRPQHRFVIDGGTGSGKTQASGHLAAFALNRKVVDQVVVVCPNRSIRRKTQRVFRDLFGIDLAIFHATRHQDGIPRTKQGYILTYAHLIQDPTLHRRICAPDTMVVFDEIHHLGDSGGWGDAAVEAFGRVHLIVALTGTPFRSDNRRIPFVTYEEVADSPLLRFKAEPPAGFSYPLGRAVHEGICRKPLFQFHDATVQLRATPESGELTVTFKDGDVNEQVAALRLRHAVRYGSVGRSKMLRTALDRCREEGRKVIVFLGGDTDGDHTPTTDATEFLPAELRELGITDDEFDVVTGEDAEAQDKIEKFGASSKWVLVSINMVSEGTDIPELSAGIFLTSITAKQTTLQRIGRVLRMMGEADPFKAALVFMFEDANLMELADEIEEEIRREVRIAKARQAPDGGNGAAEDRPRNRAEGNCIDGGNPTVIKFGNHTYPASLVDQARERCRECSLPSSMLEVVLTILMRDSHVNG